MKCISIANLGLITGGSHLGRQLVPVSNPIPVYTPVRYENKCSCVVDPYRIPVFKIAYQDTNLEQCKSKCCETYTGLWAGNFYIFRAANGGLVVSENCPNPPLGKFSGIMNSDVFL